MGDKRHILMVDDKATLCFAMREYFMLYGYHVDCAHDVEGAIALLNHSSYAVMIADLDLDGAHNLDGFRIIRMANERFSETRIIVLTAYGTAEIESEARSCGADAFLRKPKPLPEVARIVFELVGDNTKLEGDCPSIDAWNTAD